MTSKPPPGHTGKVSLDSPGNTSLSEKNGSYHVPHDQEFPSFEYGEKVVVKRENNQLQYATVRFCGYTNFCEGIFWFGVELDQPNGKNDGSVQVYSLNPEWSIFRHAC